MMTIETNFNTQENDIETIQQYKNTLLNSCDSQDYIIDGKPYCKSDAIFILDEVVHGQHTGVVKCD